MIVVYQDSKVRNNCSQSEGMKDKKDITVDKRLRKFSRSRFVHFCSFNLKIAM